VGVFGYDRHTPMSAVTDGLSTTARNGPWTAGGLPTVRALDPAGGPYPGAGGPFRSNHRYGLLAPTPPSATNVLFADGSVRALTASTKPEVFEALALLPETAPPPWWLVALGCLVALLGRATCWVPRFRRRAVLIPWGILVYCLVVLLALHFLPSVARVPDAGPLLGTHWPRLRAHATAGRPRVRHWPSAMRHSCLSFPPGGPPL
jgi:prepilin-type processing-associated H-X9-DG protein